MTNRKLPFGYRMEGGQVRIVEAEVEIVEMVFACYAKGASYETLVKSLNKGTIPYAPSRPWNKNMVARILQDERYLGDDVYPPLVTAEQFTRAEPDHAGSLACPQVKDIRILIRCPACGGAVRRERKNGWRCPNCMTASAKTNDRRLLEDVESLLRWLQDHPEAVIIPTVTVEGTDGTIENKTTALAQAAARLDALDSTDYEALRIRYILAHAGPEDSLLRQVASALLLYPDGTIHLRLKNGQTLKRSDLT